MPTFYQNKGRTTSPSKRWQTTTHSALEEVAKQMDFSEQRQATLQDMKERKVANTKTSISFGHDKVNYLSDAQVGWHSLDIFCQLVMNLIYTFA